ncbi:hypothetical protein DXA53_10845 [Odoribacter splanchnicus]|uniref:Uncharacterized protein n=2 Tax=Odoribacter splanchnicus TaxID=28118 RepID=A0A413IB81_9BACT|nr:hypothetical protein DXA53_10845 [Odoribacter splanchnicus]HCG21106.1 hypothetical protein [Odoribacter splanchnicus]
MSIRNPFGSIFRIRTSMECRLSTLRVKVFPSVGLLRIYLTVVSGSADEQIDRNILPDMG